MKRLLTLMLVLAAVLSASAQNDDHKKLPQLGFHFSGIDFQTASDFRSKSVAQVLRQGNWKSLNRVNPGLTLSYTQGLNNNLDFMGRLTGSFLSYPFRDLPNDATNRFHIEADANVNVKLLPDNFAVVPYLQAGAGLGTTNKKLFAYIPLGAGLQFNLWNDAFLHLSTSYRVPVSSSANYNIFHSVGITFPVAQRKVVVPPAPPTPPPPPDRDGDGILDANDACPDEAGVAALNGCPDKDKDGIADKDDKCVDVPGLAKYQGCPIPDTDKDGINDENDKCPTVAGVARYEGCPIPDGDGDGINDEEDKCPAVPGVASNGGCPEIKEEVKQKVEYAAKNIFFNTGSAQLLKKSFKPLDEVVKILNENPTLLLDIEGHTDNTGKPEKNQALSEARANAVRAYLTSKGIDAGRLTAAGYGSDRPVADNKTTAGRAKNRRSELKLRSF